MKLAYLGIPHFGGTHTVYVSLRDGLAGHGVEVRWLGVGSRARAVAADPAWAHERARGDVVEAAAGGERQLAEAMARHLLQAGYAGVFVNVLASRVQTNAIRYMPPGLRRIMIVHGITPATYAAAGAVRDHVDATVGVAERIRTDLCTGFGFRSDRTLTIPNAIAVDRFLAASRAAADDGPLRLLSFGRVEEAAKGVLWLPAILQRAGLGRAVLTVAGDGPDRQRLETRCAPLGPAVRFLGRIPVGAEPELYARHDVFLMPSRFEGFGQTIVEAMAAGCVPVVSRIRGVTDTIVTDGEDGFLFPVGDVGAAGAIVRRLADDRALLARLAAAARQRAAGRFGLPQQAAAYARLIREVMARPPAAPPPLPWDTWSYPAGLRPGLRTWLPEPVKNVLRTWRERRAA
jgi:glycosyltransferase involved in cell wall biosynthesis